MWHTFFEIFKFFYELVQILGLKRKDCIWRSINVPCAFIISTQNSVNSFLFTARNGNNLFLPATDSREFGLSVRAVRFSK